MRRRAIFGLGLLRDGDGDGKPQHGSSNLPETLVFIFIFAFGAAVGSFLNVCICRVPERLSVVSPPSHCPRCDAPIKFYDNIPIVSWFVLLGRCRRCSAPISPEYPLVEAITGLFAVLLFLRFGLTPDFVVYSVFTAALITVTFIDLRLRIIPDVISLPGIPIGFVATVLVAWHGGDAAAVAIESVIGILTGGGILLAVAWVYFKATGTEGMGGGDIKLLAMVGAFCGWKGALFTLFAGSFAGALVGGALMVFFGKDQKYAVPFGPFLAVGALCYLFFGDGLIGWYLLRAGLQ